MGWAKGILICIGLGLISMFFWDVNLWQKAWVLGGILAGLLCILISGV